MAAPDLIATDKLETPTLMAGSARLALLDAVILYGTFALLMFGPLAFGAVEFWAVFSLQLGTVTLLLLWAARQAMSPELDLVGNPLFAPMLVFGAVIAAQLVLGTSAYRYSAMVGAALYLCYGGLAFLTAQSLRRTSQVKLLACLLSGYGAAVALFALVQSLSSQGRLYWIREAEAGGAIYGPYVNRNHYAGLMEMLFPIALAVLLSDQTHRKWKPAFACAAVLMAGTIFLSGSRGGMLAFAAQMAFLALLFGMQKNRRAALITGCLLSAIVLVMLWVGGQQLVTRVLSIHSEARTELDGGLRLTVDRDSLRMFAKRPVLGWGLHSFGEIYPRFRSFSTSKTIDQAHNDYLQLLVETGIVGFAAGMWLIGLVFRHATAKLKNWARDVNGTVALASLLGCIGILVHAFFDFNLQIPANAAFFYVLCTIAASHTSFGAHRKNRHVSSRR